ncbi:MAG: glycosyltransferase family 2 protein [Rudaea sp.]
MPDLSIILLTKNGMPLLEQTLKQIYAQEIDRSFEVIAVDSGSTDGTLELLAKYPVRLIRIPPQQFNFGATRAMAYDLAEGEFCITLSQDAVPADPSWLAEMVAPFSDPSVAAVRGEQKLGPGSHYFYWARIGRYYVTRSAVRWRARYGFTFSNVNSAIRKSTWDQNRIGPAEMSEDKFLQKVWVDRGIRFVRATKAVVYHGHNFNLKTLIRRSENEGLGNRLSGQTYSLWDALMDTLDIQNWIAFWRGLVTRQITTEAEFLSPFIRPFLIWKGNRFNQKYYGSD